MGSRQTQTPQKKNQRWPNSGAEEDEGAIRNTGSHQLKT
jgi:hypothetical protein